MTIMFGCMIPTLFLPLLGGGKSMPRFRRSILSTARTAVFPPPERGRVRVGVNIICVGIIL